MRERSWVWAEGKTVKKPVARAILLRKIRKLVHT